MGLLDFTTPDEMMRRFKANEARLKEARQNAQIRANFVKMYDDNIALLYGRPDDDERNLGEAILEFLENNLRVARETDVWRNVTCPHGGGNSTWGYGGNHHLCDVCTKALDVTQGLS